MNGHINIYIYVGMVWWININVLMMMKRRSLFCHERRNVSSSTNELYGSCGHGRSKFLV